MNWITQRSHVELWPAGTLSVSLTTFNTNIRTSQSFSPFPIPLHQPRHRRGGPGTRPGPGYWLHPGAQWPQSDWEAERQTGAGGTKTRVISLRLHQYIHYVRWKPCMSNISSETVSVWWFNKHWKLDIIITFITCSSLSAAGLFLGFLVRAVFTNWWKFSLLQRKNDIDWTQNSLRKETPENNNHVSSY